MNESAGRRTRRVRRPLGRVNGPTGSPIAHGRTRCDRASMAVKRSETNATRERSCERATAETSRGRAPATHSTRTCRSATKRIRKDAPSQQGVKREPQAYARRRRCRIGLRRKVVIRMRSHPRSCWGEISRGESESSERARTEPTVSCERTPCEYETDEAREPRRASGGRAGASAEVSPGATSRAKANGAEHERRRRSRSRGEASCERHPDETETTRCVVSRVGKAFAQSPTGERRSSGLASESRRVRSA